MLQDDIVYAELTVRENLIFSGKFRLPKGTPDAAIEDLADETLANLGLSRVANSLVGDVKRRGVSGGEKKRVNIGLELMALPSVVFLDEPTSGLVRFLNLLHVFLILWTFGKNAYCAVGCFCKDASSALLVMQSLKHLVDIQGVTVVAVIHQPRKFIFDLFDSLILLGVGGRMVYHGAVDKSLTYFRNLNYTLPPGESLADWLIDISSGRLEPDNLVASSKVLEVEKAKEEKAKESKTKKSKEKKSKTKKSKGESRGKSPHGARLTAASRQASQGLVVRRSGPKETKNAVEHAAPGTPVRDSDAVGSRGVATGKVAQAFEEAKARRAWLYEEWNSYFTNLSEADLDIYDVPEKSDLPKEVVKPAFYKQFYFQMWRALWFRGGIGLAKPLIV